MNTKLFTLSLLACLFGSAHATTLFFDDFESGTPGTVPGGWDQTTNTDENKHTWIATDDGSIFSASNQYVDLVGKAPTGFPSFFMTKIVSGMGGELTSFAFDFYEPDVDLGDNRFVAMGITSSGGDINPADAAALIYLNNGSISFETSGDSSTGFSYNTDQAYRINLVANDSGAAATIFGENLAAGSYGLWFDDSYAGSANLSGAALEKIGFRKFNAGSQQAYVDNVEVSVIPEPASILLVGVSLLALGVFYRRRT